MQFPIRRYARLLATYVRTQYWRMAILAVLIFANIGLSLLNPQIIRYFIDTALAGGSRMALQSAALAFLGAALCIQVLTVLARYFSEQVAWTATNALRTDLVAHCINLDLSFHKAHTPGELLERVDGDVETLAQFFSNFVINIVGNSLLLCGALVLLYREDWRIGLGLTVFAIAALLILIRLRTIAIPYWAKARQLAADFYGFLGEHLGATEDLRANGATGYTLQRFHQMLRTWLPVQLRANLAGYSMWMSSLAVFAVGTMLSFGLSAPLYQTGIITLGTVYLIFTYTELIRTPIFRLREQLTDLQKAEAGIQRIEALFATHSSLAPGRGDPLPDGALRVELRNVTFRYEEQETVLDEISFRLEPGRVLGLLGRTGSGKSTLARLLLRLYDPQIGVVALGDVPAQATDLIELRRHVGMVTQDVQLFQASVRDNLTFFNPAIEARRIEQVLLDLGLGDWLRGLPQGIETPLAGGTALSAGQAQLLALARIFLADPGLVILDEASSRLDPATETLLEAAIDKLLQSRTAIIIAHRLRTIERADEILILEQGRMLEYGPRRQLAADSTSHFYRLLQVGLEEVLV